MEIIKSKDNNKIKYVRSLNSKKNRDAENAFIIEGIKFVEEAIKENAHIMYLIFNENSLNKNEIKDLYGISNKTNAETIVCDDRVFNSIADTINAQGVLAVIKKHDDKISVNDYKFVIMCDRIQDPGNLGTIIRTVDAFGPGVVILNKGCVDAYNPKVMRASAGTIFRVPVIQAENDLEFLNMMKDNGFYIVTTVVDSEYSFDNMEKRQKICIVIGNEGGGVSQEIIDNSDISLTIKMTGRAESLNASVAAGISIYEIRKNLLK